MGNNRICEKMHSINRITNEINSLYHTAALKLQLSDSALYILYMLYDHGGSCPLHTIYEAGICKQTVNSAVRKLETAELLRLEPYKGKNKLAVFTEKGKAFAAQSAARLYAAEEDTFADWTDAEIDTFIALHQKYLDSFRNEIEKL